MTRPAARIRHDEVRRLVRAVQSCGLTVGQVKFDGEAVYVVIGGDSGEKQPEAAGQTGGNPPLLREPEL